MPWLIVVDSFNFLIIIIERAISHCPVTLELSSMIFYHPDKAQLERHMLKSRLLFLVNKAQEFRTYHEKLNRGSNIDTGTYIEVLKHDLH